MRPETKAKRTENLLKLATYLESLPKDYEEFDMQSFVHTLRGSYGNPDLNDYALHNGGVTKCGTTACAVGHGPTAGILFPKSLVDSYRGPDWWSYTIRFFLGGHHDYPAHVAYTTEFKWLFDEDWEAHDNHHWGAAARIRYYLQNGIPDDFVNPDKSFKKAYRHVDKRYTRSPA